MKWMSLLVVVTAALASATAAAAGDPRVCSRATPGGTAKHSYWCAQYAAVTAAKAAMAKHKGMSRWYAPTYCTQGPTVLRWRCQTSLGGDSWKVAIMFRKTAAGWRTATTITGP